MCTKKEETSRTPMEIRSEIKRLEKKLLSLDLYSVAWKVLNAKIWALEWVLSSGE